jgi:hypothetical protein
MSALLSIVKMTTATTGTGTITLGSAVSGFLTAAQSNAVNGRTYSYGIADGSNSEVGYGVYTSSGTTLTRNVIASTNGNAAINLSGSAVVFFTPNERDFLTGGETDVASATTCDIGAAATRQVRITGTTTITSFGTVANAICLVRFAGILTLTYNATSLILLGAATRTTAAGDVGLYTSDASGNWRELMYFRAASDLTSMFVAPGQIKFPATQNASADANTLDDYEEGTFTPTFTASTTPPTGVTYAEQVGAYTKIGNLVTYSYSCGLSSKGTGGVGRPEVAGLPFSQGALGRPGGLAFFGSYANVTLSDNIQLYGFNTGTNVTYYEIGEALSFSDAAWSAVGNASYIRQTGHYYV